MRDVPVVTVDFGGGNIVKKTLHGNIATYVCFPDGRIVDVLPGVYSASAYRVALQEIAKLAVMQPDVYTLANYHNERTQVAGSPYWPRPDASKIYRESGTKSLIKPVAAMPLPAVGSARTEKFGLLAADVDINERRRRAVIHQRLASNLSSKPADIEKWLYKEVLHADLDDPFLGLSPLLSSDAPFVEYTSREAAVAAGMH